MNRSLDEFEIWPDPTTGFHARVMIVHTLVPTSGYIHETLIASVVCCKQLGHRSDLTNWIQSDSHSEIYFEIVSVDDKKLPKLPSMQRV